MGPKVTTRDFLQLASQFRLGHLITEGFHPKTRGLSTLAGKDLPAALSLLQEVDVDALKLMAPREEEVWGLASDIAATLSSGHKVFMCGCGATGRLSLVLEALFRQMNGPSDKVVSFMAGGDYALIKSVESFEDRVEYGERQLRELGFGPHDLLLSSTEGGETPFVIGATNSAARMSSRAPYFLYCNPDELLFSIERSREVIENSKIKKLNLTVGPMAISGSTRMQASTVLMLAIGTGLLREHRGREDFGEYYQGLLRSLMKVSYEKFAGLTSLEARLYREGKYLNYVSDPGLAISILTDTTERSPTFSLRGFENQLENKGPLGLSYLFVEGASDSESAWKKLLGREPRALSWEGLPQRIGLAMVLGFDISEQGLKFRSERVPCVSFNVSHHGDRMNFSCGDEMVSIAASSDFLFNHLTVKMLLNAHSTLIMGLLGRYEGNVMTYVRPSNNKLIDRAARYVQQILKSRGMDVGYETVVEEIFLELETMAEKSVVLSVVERLVAG